MSPDSSTAYIGGVDEPPVPVNTVQGTAGNPLSSSLVGYGAMALSPDGTTMYVSVEQGISEYQPATGKVTADAIPVPGDDGGIYGVAVSPDGSTLYAADRANGDVYVIGIATKTVTSTIPLSGAAEAVQLSPDGSRLYVSENESDTIAVINTATDTVTATIKMPTNGTLNMNITDTTCISPDGSTLYVPGAPLEPVQVVSTATRRCR